MRRLYKTANSLMVTPMVMLTRRFTSSTSTKGSFVRKAFLDVTPMVMLENVK